MTDLPNTLVPCEWRVVGLSPLCETRIVAVAQKEGLDLYAVRCNGDCLNKAGLWVYEPNPSSRSEVFIRHCRWETFDEAATAALAHPHP